MKGIDRVGGNKELRTALYRGALSFMISLPNKPKTSLRNHLNDKHPAITTVTEPSL